MRVSASHIFTLVLTVLFFLTTTCNSRTDRKANKSRHETITQNKKEDFELADEFLAKLKNEKADTIIFYKRTCISCCDFFNIFWSAKGQRRLTKFYFDFKDMQTHSKTVNLTSNKVFEMLSKNYNELKNTSIKDNAHKNNDGTSTLVRIDHYCYAQMSIYTNQDSIITDRMKDHDFDKYTDFGLNISDKREKLQINDNYIENTKSKWNLFLITIENEIAVMPETISRELEKLRIRKSEK